MRTIRITRQGFPNHGMHSWVRYFVFILSKKYNVIIDPANPDIIIQSNLNSDPNSIDTFTGVLPTAYSYSDKSKRFIYVSGEIADFVGAISEYPNVWSIGYNNVQHPRFLRQPSCVIDVWTLFDEARMVDSPYEWMTTKRSLDDRVRFCCITQASESEFRGKVVDAIQQYQTVDSSGPWRQNLFGGDTLNRHQWLSHLYSGRMDGLSYREKIEFFRKYKFNIAIHYTDVDYVVQEKIIHAYFAGCIPIYYGNRFITQEGFNPDSFINLHEVSLADLPSKLKEINESDNLRESYLGQPIFKNNIIPEYYGFDYTLSFLDKIIETL